MPSPLRTLQILCFLTTWTFIGQGRDATAQPPTWSQRPLPMPENGSSSVENQFRVMQQLQRLMTGSNPQAETKTNVSPKTESQKPFGPSGFDPGKLDPALLDNLAKDLNPEQRDALRDLMQQFQTDGQKSNQPNAPNTPQPLEEMLKKFLTERRLPEPDGNGGGLQIPNSNPQPQSKDPNPRNQTESPRSAASPQDSRPQDGAETNRPPETNRPIENRRPIENPRPSEPRQSGRTNESGANGDGATQQLGNENFDDDSSVQDLIKRLRDDADSLPPLEPPPHLEQPQKGFPRTGSSQANDPESPSGPFNSNDLRQRAIERQNQARGGQPTETERPRSDPSAPQSSIDPETAERLRSTAQKRGIGQALRDIVRETQKEAKEEAKREARLKAERETEARMAAAREAADRLARENAARQDSASSNENQNPNAETGPSRSDPFSPDNIASKNRPTASNGGTENRTPGDGASGMDGLIDEDMINSLFSDRQALEDMLKTLQEARAAQSASRSEDVSPGNRSDGLPQRNTPNAAELSGAPDTSSLGGDLPQNLPNRSPQNLPKNASRNGASTQADGGSQDRGNSMAKQFSEWLSDTIVAPESRNNSANNASNNSSQQNEQPSNSGSGGGLPEFQFPLPNLPFLIVLAVVVGLAVWWFRKGQAVPIEARRREIYARLMPKDIGSRDDLIKAFHCVALASSAAPQRWWPHPKTAEVLANTSPDAKSAVFTLAQLYEIARYTPDGNRMTHDQLSQANQALTQLKGL